jgi:hypothetical protein
VSGVEVVERMPEFAHWNVKPAVGQVLEPTTNLFNSPYSVILLGNGTLAEVHRTLVLEVDGPLAARLLLRARHESARVRRLLDWLAWRARRAVLGALKPGTPRELLSSPR